MFFWNSCSKIIYNMRERACVILFLILADNVNTAWNDKTYFQWTLNIIKVIEHYIYISYYLHMVHASICSISWGSYQGLRFHVSATNIIIACVLHHVSCFLQERGIIDMSFHTFCTKDFNNLEISLPTSNTSCFGEEWPSVNMLEVPP